MLTFAGTDENQNTCFRFIGMDNKPSGVRLITDNTSLISTNMPDGGLDTCSFYSGPSDSTITAFGESYAGTPVAYSGTTGYSSSMSGCESSGTIASGSVSSSSFSSGSSSSYSACC